tara:strand:+ start:382 stop:579 length:198 start_codon:yes stop_codon:yes gene_type:complete
MFVAQIVVCGFLNGQCILLEDLKGPKFSLEICKSRQEEMFEDISRQLPYVNFGGSRCVKTGKYYI